MTCVYCLWGFTEAAVLVTFHPPGGQSGDDFGMDLSPQLVPFDQLQSKLPHWIGLCFEELTGFGSPS